MNKRSLAVAQARQRADIARLQFIAALGATKARIAPQRIKDDALIAITDKVDEVRSSAISTVRERPILSAAVGSGLAIALLWRPARAAGRTYGALSARICTRIKQWRKSR